MNTEIKDELLSALESFTANVAGLEGTLPTVLTKILPPKTPTDEKKSTTPYADFYKPVGLVETAKIAKFVYDLKDKLDDMKKVFENLNTIFTRNVLPDLIDDAGLKSPVKVEGVAKLVLQPDMFVKQVYGDDEEQKFFDWLIEAGQSDLIKETVNASALKSVLKSIIDKNNDLLKIEENRGKELKEVDGYMEIPDTLLKVEPFWKVAFNKL